VFQTAPQRSERLIGLCGHPPAWAVPFKCTFGLRLGSAGCGISLGMRPTEVNIEGGHFGDRFKILTDAPL
jgi:hypothetical protein